MAMDIDRNRYFMFGVVLFLLGLQFRLVDSFVLNDVHGHKIFSVVETIQQRDDRPTLSHNSKKIVSCWL